MRFSSPLTLSLAVLFFQPPLFARSAEPAMSHSLDEMIAQLGAADAEQRAAAAEAISQLAEDAQPAAIPLVKALADEDDSVREWATSALEGLGPPRTQDLAELARLAGGQEPDASFWAVTLLGRAAVEAAQFASVLVEVLQAHPSADVRRKAAWALGQLGDVAAAREALRIAAAGQDQRVAHAARAALDQP